jgi:hypothetical protein
MSARRDVDCRHNHVDQRIDDQASNDDPESTARSLIAKILFSSRDATVLASPLVVIQQTETTSQV